MKPISIHVPEAAYQELKSLAAREGRPAAELFRQALAEYLARQRQQASSILDLPPHESGALRSGWSRDELFEEMLES